MKEIRNQLPDSKGTKTWTDSLDSTMQREAFAEELASLEKEKCVGKSSRLLSFAPYLDEDEIIRVGGRLDHAKLPYEIRHPIILSPKHRLTELSIEYYHRLENHGGVHHCVSFNSQKILDHLWTTRSETLERKVCSL